MKKYTLLFVALVAALTSQAQLDGNGYYRVQNVYTNRYIRVIDDYGKIDIASTTADMTAIQTIKNFGNVVSDPASIIYIEKKTTGYNLYTQGTNTYRIVGYYPLIADNGNNTYKAYAENAGMVAYLADEISSADEGVVVSNSKKSRDWYIIPVTQETDHFFGLNPSIRREDTYYMSFYAEFPFTFSSDGMKAYYVNKLDEELSVAVYEELTGEIPGAMPLIISSKSDKPVDNKLDIHKSAIKAPKGNLLKGVYFCNPKNRETNPHHNVVKNDPTTMRVLGFLSDGTVGFIKSSDTYIPRNSAYLTVTASAADEIHLMSSEEYKTLLAEVEEENKIEEQKRERAFANEYGSGYYRLQNVTTGRFLTVAASTGDKNRDLQTRKMTDYGVTSAGSIFRIDVLADGYRLKSQGVDINALNGGATYMRKNDDGSFLIYNQIKNGKKYLGDENGTVEVASVTDDKALACWMISPVDLTDEHFFGLSPTVSDGTFYYQPLCVDFPVTLADDMKALVLTDTDDSLSVAIWEEYDSKSIPADMPIIVRCQSNSAAMNRLAIQDNDALPLSANLLKGILLTSPSEGTEVRVLGRGKDGKLVLQQPGPDGLSSNSVYMEASDGAPTSFSLLTPKEYESMLSERDEQRREKMFAEIVGNGYYRVQNKRTGRYLCLASLTDDVISSLQAVKEYDNVKSNPSSVIHVQLDGDDLQLGCQGHILKARLGDELHLRYNDDGSFLIYTSTVIGKIYLGDKDNGSTTNSLVNDASCASWIFVPVDGSFGRDFVLAPSLTDGTYYWQPFCADFPYTLSAGMKAYIVTSVDATLPATVWEEYEENDIPAGMPVIIRCAFAGASRNKLNIQDNNTVAPIANLLQGFLMADKEAQSTYLMNVIDKQPVWESTSYESIPANTAYLSAVGIGMSCPLLSQQEYEQALLTSGITPVSFDASHQPVYDMLGRHITGPLSAGIYIIDGHKVVIK